MLMIDEKKLVHEYGSGSAVTEPNVSSFQNRVADQWPSQLDDSYLTSGGTEILTVNILT